MPSTAEIPKGFVEVEDSGIPPGFVEVGANAAPVNPAPVIDANKMAITDPERYERIKRAEQIQATRMKLAESAESVLPTIIREPVYGMMGAGASLASTLTRPLSKDMGDYFAQAGEQLGVARESMRKDDWFPRLSRLYGGAAESLTTATIAAPAGGAGVIGTLAVTEANQALYDAEKAGLKGEERMKYALTQGAIEGSIAGAFQAVGLGGAEKLVGGVGRTIMRNLFGATAKTGAKRGTAAFAREFLKQASAEEVEELATEYGHALAEKAYGIDINATDWGTLEKPGPLQERFIDTAGQTLLMVGGAQGMSSTARSIARKQRLDNLKEIRAAKGAEIKKRAAEEGITGSRSEVRKQLDEEINQLELEKTDEEELQDQVRKQDVVEGTGQVPEQATDEEGAAEVPDVSPEELDDILNKLGDPFEEEQSQTEKPDNVRSEEETQEPPILTHYTNSESGPISGEGAFGPGTVYAAKEGRDSDQMWSLRGKNARKFTISPEAKVFVAKSFEDLDRLANQAGLGTWGDAERALNSSDNAEAKRAKDLLIGAGFDAVDVDFEGDEYTPSQFAVLNPDVITEETQQTPREKAQGKQGEPVPPYKVPPDEAEAAAEVNKLREQNKRRGRKDQRPEQKEPENRTMSGSDSPVSESTNRTMSGFEDVKPPRSKGRKRPETPQEAVPANQAQEPASQPETRETGDTAAETGSKTHHVAEYGGKTVVIDYVEGKNEFRVAAQRVRDNLKTGDIGYVTAPDGKRYEISTSSRKAKLVKPKPVPENRTLSAEQSGEQSKIDYSKNTSAELIQILKKRKVPGRSKATNNEKRIEMLEEWDRQNPDAGPVSFDKPKKRKKRPPKEPRTLLQAVKSLGGLDSGRVGKGERININEDMKQFGLLGAFTGRSGAKGKFDLEEMVRELESGDYWRAPEGVPKGEALLNALKEGGLTFYGLEQQSQEEMAAEEAEMQREYENARKEGFTESEITEALRIGEEDGAEEGLSEAQVAEDERKAIVEEIGDTSFDFGEKPGIPGEQKAFFDTKDQGNLFSVSKSKKKPDSANQERSELEKFEDEQKESKKKSLPGQKFVTRELADEALEDLKRELKELDDETRDTLFLNPLGNPKLALKVGKVTYKIVKAGTLQFAAYVEEMTAKIGQEYATKIMPVLRSEWTKLQKTGEFEGMESIEPPVNKADNVRFVDQETTGIKHEKTDELREKIGIGPRQSPEPRTWEYLNAEAERIIREDPEYAQNLAEELVRKPETGNDLKNFIIDRYIRDLENRRQSGEDVMAELVTAISASNETGAEAGRFLSSRKAELYSDFTIAELIRKHLREFDEQPSAEWIAKYEKMEADVKAAQEKAAAAEQKLAEYEAGKAIDQAKSEKPQAKPKKGTRKSKREEQRKESVAAFKKEWDSLFQVSIISDPKADAEKWAQITKAAAKVVKVYISTGVDSALEMFSLVKSEIGDLTPEQEEAFREAWAAEGVQSPLGDSPESGEIGARAKMLMRWAVEQGIDGRDEVVEAVQSALEEEGVTLSRVETMQAMSDYGIYRELPKDAVSVKVRQYRGELQQLMKLRDIEAGVIPSLTGREQRTPSDEENRIRHDVHESMKRSGFSTNDPTKIRTPLSSKKKAVDKRLSEVDDEIRQLTDNIKQGTPLKQDGQRTELKVDDELIEMQSKLDQAYLERDELRKQSPAWQQREENKSRDRYEKSLRRRIEFWEERLSNAKRGIIPEKRTMSGFADDFREANAKISKIKAEALEEIEKEKRRRWNLGQKIGHDLAEGTATIPRTLMAGLELSAVLRQGFFYTHAHPVLSFFNTVSSVQSVFSDRYAMAQEEDIQQRPNASEYSDAGIEFTVETGPRDRVEEMYQSSLFKWLSNQKNPVKYVGKVYGAFERGFRTFSNTMKADLYDIQKRDTLAAREWFSEHGIGRQGWSKEDMKLAGRSANIWSGRGTGLMPGRSFLDWLYFARRWVWSRVQAEFILPFQVATPSFIGQWNGDAGMRVSHAKLYGQAAIGALTHLAALYWIMSLIADDDDEEPSIETSPLSTDFGKIRTGDTRIDVLGGLPQLWVLANRIIRGKTKTSKGEIKDIRGENVDYGAPGVWDAFAQTMRYKLGPSASGIVDFFAGETAVGGKLSEDPMKRATEVVGQRMLPMAYKDMWEAEKQLGVKRGTIAAIEGFFGASVNTYGLKTDFANADESGREEQLEKYLKSMKWDSPDPPYSDMLTKNQRDQIERKRRYRAGAIIYRAASDPPQRKNYQNYMTLAEGQERHRKAIETLVEMKRTMSLNEALTSLAIYSLDRGFTDETYEARKEKVVEFYQD